MLSNQYKIRTASSILLSKVCELYDSSHACSLQWARAAHRDVLVRDCGGGLFPNKPYDVLPKATVPHTTRTTTLQTQVPLHFSNLSGARNSAAAAQPPLVGRE